MVKAKQSDNHPVTQYALDITEGRIVACKYVKLACKRHLDDLEKGHKRGLYFDEEAADRSLRWFSIMHHYKGEWAGSPITLEPWQQFCIGSVFGWKKKDGTRRFRMAYEEVARKNGKSTKLGGLANYLLVADGEKGAEVYCAATKKDQAKIVFHDAVKMMKAAPNVVRKLVGFTGGPGKENQMYMTSTSSLMTPLGRDSDTQDGLNVHAAIIDEYHAHKDSTIFNVLDTATGSRTQSLIYIITTAGFNKQGPCFKLREYVAGILEGKWKDDSTFGIIYTLDDGDKWNDPKVWIKANPNLNVSVKLDDIKRLAVKAGKIPSQLNNFLTKRLNIWTSQEEAWFNMDDWEMCSDPVDVKSLMGRPCYGGLDLASKIDLAAYVLIFPPMEEGEKWKVVCYFFMPEDNVQRRVELDKIPYDTWVSQGFIETTEGNVTDYDYIEERIKHTATLFDVKELAFDPWNSTQIVTHLMDDGAEMVEFRQGFASMNQPSKELEKMVVGHELQHGGNPVLTWMAGNVAIMRDPADNIKPAKNKSKEKIDGIVALIMAIGRAIVEGDESSVYEERGIRTV